MGGPLFEQKIIVHLHNFFSKIFYFRGSALLNLVSLLSEYQFQSCHWRYLTRCQENNNSIELKNKTPRRKGALFKHGWMQGAMKLTLNFRKYKTFYYACLADMNVVRARTLS